MARHEGPTNATNVVPVEPAITRAFWSTRRAWHGAEVKLFIETRHVPDGTTVAIQIWEDDAGEGSDDDFIAEVEGQHEIQKNRCIIPYTIRWDEASLGEPLALEGDRLEFYFRVTIEELGLEARSSLLYVDLQGFTPSL